MAINPAEITTIRTGQLVTEPPLLSSIIAHELTDELFKCTIQDLVDLLSLNVGTLQYEIKTLYVDQEYIDTNFDATGLGRLLCLGFAICNGNNGTVPFTGLVEVACDMDALQTYSIGNTDGTVTHTLIEDEMPIHNHEFDVQNISSGSIGNKIQGTNTIQSPTQTSTTTAGGGQPHNNMQPYICVLKIMKL